MQDLSTYTGTIESVSHVRITNTQMSPFFARPTLPSFKYLQMHIGSCEMFREIEFFLAETSTSMSISADSNRIHGDCIRFT